MKYEEALNTFGEELNLDCSDRRFLISLVDPEIRPDDVLIRVEVSFLSDLGELQPNAQGGVFESIKSGRISASMLFDWGLLGPENGQQFIDFCRNWDPSVYYSKGAQRQRALIVGGSLKGSLVEFIGPTGLSCAGLTRLSIENGKLAIGAGPSKEGKAFIKNLLAGARPTPAEVLF